MLKLRFKNNKHNAVWLVEPKVTIGRKLTNDLIVDDSAVIDLHAEILVKHENLTLVNLAGGDKVLINNQIVENSAPLNINDEVRVGNTLLEVIDPKLEARPEQKKTEAPQATGWALKAHSAALGNRVFAIKPVTSIGRSNECDITLGVAHLSRRHAELSVREGLLYVKDLGSANGTYLNGERVVEARVKRGDELRFDTLSFGVIGPAEDMDKTTIRPVSAVVAPAKSSRPAIHPQSPLKPAPTRPRTTAGVNRPEAMNNATANAANASRGPTPNPAIETRSASTAKLLWGLGALGLVALVVTVAYQQGLF